MKSWIETGHFSRIVGVKAQTVLVIGLCCHDEWIFVVAVSVSVFSSASSHFISKQAIWAERQKKLEPHTHTHTTYTNTHTQKNGKKKFLFSRRHGRVVDNKKPRGPIQQKTMTPSPSKWKKLFNNQTAQQTPARIFRCNRKRIGNKSSWHNHIGTEFAQEHKAHEQKKTTRKNKNGQALVFFFFGYYF